MFRGRYRRNIRSSVVRFENRKIQSKHILDDLRLLQRPKLFNVPVAWMFFAVKSKAPTIQRRSLGRVAERINRNDLRGILRKNRVPLRSQGINTPMPDRWRYRWFLCRIPSVKPCRQRFGACPNRHPPLIRTSTAQGYLRCIGSCTAGWCRATGTKKWYSLRRFFQKNVPQ